MRKFMLFLLSGAALALSAAPGLAQDAGGRGPARDPNATPAAANMSLLYIMNEDSP